MRHKSCTQFSFFQIIRQNVVNDGFWHPVLSAIILQLVWRLSFKTAATRAMFLLIFIVPGLPLRSASSIYSSPTTNQTLLQTFPMFWQLLIPLYNKILLQHVIQNFFPWLFITGTKHTILQSALILPHIELQTWYEVGEEFK